MIIGFAKELSHLGSIDCGWGNGYVAVPPGHPWHGVSYMDIECDIHGGLTYGQTKNNLNWYEAKDVPVDYYIVGFDTAHYGDSKHSCPKEYVLDQVEYLKKQAMEAAA